MSPFTRAITAGIGLGALAAIPIAYAAGQFAAGVVAVCTAALAVVILAGTDD